jgi:DHHC palmitoyltransferase
MGYFKKLLINSAFLVTVFIYSMCYYAYFQEIFEFDSAWTISICILIHTFLFLSIFYLVMTMVTNPGETPVSFNIENIPENQKETIKEDYLEIDFTLGRITLCKKCDKYRPPRSHHCGICEKCILRFDHHCPFVANCIGFRNLKYFILFLSFSTLDLLIFFIESLRCLINSPGFPLYFITPCLGVFFIYFVGFVIVHIWNLCENCTTLESRWAHNIFNTGSTLENLSQVLGSSKIQWFLPGKQEEYDGINYPIKIRSKSGGFVNFQNKFLI